MGYLRAAEQFNDVASSLRLSPKDVSDGVLMSDM